MVVVFFLSVLIRSSSRDLLRRRARAAAAAEAEAVEADAEAAEADAEASSHPPPSTMTTAPALGAGEGDDDDDDGIVFCFYSRWKEAAIVTRSGMIGSGPMKSRCGITTRNMMFIAFYYFTPVHGFVAPPKRKHATKAFEFRVY